MPEPNDSGDSPSYPNTACLECGQTYCNCHSESDRMGRAPWECDD